MKRYLLLILLLPILQGCFNEESLKLPNEGYVPIQLNDGLEISTPVTEGIDESILQSVYDEFYNEDNYPTIRSLLVLKNGKLVAEAYFKDSEDLVKPHALQSATKSITSIITGIAIDKGIIPSTDVLVKQYFPEYLSEEKESITISHLLSMSAGVSFDNEVHTEKMINEATNSIKYALSFDLDFSPGTGWWYCDGNNQVISGIIAQTTNMSLEAFGKQHLFDPLNINKYRWEQHKDGTTYGAIGLWLSPRSMAKIGLMMLDNGRYNGEQIVSESWITTSTAIQNPQREYGYNWALFEYYGFYASGHGGQKIYIFPEEQMVIVTTADSYSANWVFLDDIEQIANRIRVACF